MEHFYQNIQGWFSYERIYQEAVEFFPSGSRFVEIGSFKGRSSAFLAVEIINSGKNITLDLIDTWKGSIEHQEGEDCEVLEVKNGTLYDTFLNNMKPVEGNFNAIKMTSLEAAVLYPDRSIDFLMIDGAHEFESVVADIRAYLPKMKHGGVMTGDDAWMNSEPRAAAEQELAKYGVEFPGNHFVAVINHTHVEEPRIPMEHFYSTIPGWFNYHYLYRNAVNIFPNGSRFVEVGSFMGRSSAFMAVEIINSGKDITLDLIDTWEGSSDHVKGAVFETPEVVNGTLYETFLNNMKPLVGHYNAIRMKSVDAAALYPDKSIDFLLIDGAHDFNSVVNDIRAFLPKMKIGGIIAGDDAWPGSEPRLAAEQELAKYGLYFPEVEGEWLPQVHFYCIIHEI